MALEKVSLFNTKRDFFIFLLLCGFILFYSLLIEFNNYKNLTKFDSYILDATLVKQYLKNKISKRGKIKTYQVLKFKSHKGFQFYTSIKKTFPCSLEKQIKLEIWAGKISFYEYMTSFYAYSKIKSIKETFSAKQKLNAHLDFSHEDKDISSIYKALYTATQQPKHLQTLFSSLGISHLLAISGFHLGVLSALLFFLFRSPYKYLQNKYFPYRSYKVDSFIIISLILFSYLLFLDSPPSLLRAFVMLVIGFILYDRGFKILSMWTLFLTAVLILSFTPRLVFSIGFWLSIFGVFYIFLFLIHFKNLNKIWQFLLVPIWVYLMMLPFSLFIFENFSLYHPTSIVLTSLFSLFYPLSIGLHLIGFGDILDSSLSYLLNFELIHTKVSLTYQSISFVVLLSALSIYKKLFVYVLLLFNIFIFIYAINNVT